MAKQKVETEIRPGRVLKKVSAESINLSKQKEGVEIEGKFISISMREREVVEKDGEVKLQKLYTMVIENERGERTKFLADAGLRMNIEDAGIREGDWFKAVKGPKEDIGKGRTMNTWDIYQYVDEN